MATCLKPSASLRPQAHTHTCAKQPFLPTSLAPAPRSQLSPARTEGSCLGSTESDHLFRIIILSSALQGHRKSLTGFSVQPTSKAEAEIITSISNTQHFFLKKDSTENSEKYHNHKTSFLTTLPNNRQIPPFLLLTPLKPAHRTYLPVSCTPRDHSHETGAVKAFSPPGFKGFLFPETPSSALTQHRHKPQEQKQSLLPSPCF